MLEARIKKNTPAWTISPLGRSVPTQGPLEISQRLSRGCETLGRVGPDSAVTALAPQLRHTSLPLNHFGRPPHLESRTDVPTYAGCASRRESE